MPLLRLQTTVTPTAEQQPSLLAALSRIVTEAIGKPEQYVMVTLETTPMLLAGQPGPAAFADVRSIGGLNSRVNKQIAQQLCALLEQSLAIPPARVYLNFSDVPASHWGWNGGTFG
jgi:phenylpyruvate tautomerase PptA (4-oxalocrotonate tautomerase family)